MENTPGDLALGPPEQSFLSKIINALWCIASVNSPLAAGVASCPLSNFSNFGT